MADEQATNPQVSTPDTTTVTTTVQPGDQVQPTDTQTQQPQGNEENTQQGTDDKDITNNEGTTPPPPSAPTQEEYDKLASRLKEYELTDNEIANLKNRLGVENVDYNTAQVTQALDIIQNQAQQEYIKLCNKYGVDYRPEAIEASSKALLEKDPKSYYELQTSLDRLSRSYEAKQQEVQNYVVSRDVNSFYSENNELLQASPVLNNLVNEYINSTPQQYVNRNSLNDLLSRAKSIYQEAFQAGIQYGKLNLQTNPNEVLNNSVAVQQQQTYPTQSGSHVFTRDEIRKMDDATFAKNQKLIEQQMIQGLIK